LELFQSIVNDRLRSLMIIAFNRINSFDLYQI